MKNALLILVIIALEGMVSLQGIHAASKQKYGKVSADELKMSVYNQDSTATALYLIRNGKTHYAYRDGFRLVTEYWVRIKVFGQQGTEYANVEIPYYSPDDKLKQKDEVSGIEGCSYNWENGKAVKSEMDKALVSDERVTPNYRIVKFSLPNVKAGTVFEYKYTLSSDYFYQLEGWMMQHDIPLAYSEYILSIPNLFIYNMEFRGKPFIDIRKKDIAITGANTIAGSLSSDASDITLQGQEYTFISQNIPAIRPDEPFCWCPNDHRIQIVFELQGTNWPGVGYKAYSKSWPDVDRELLRSDNELFGKWMEMPNPFLEETKARGKGINEFEAKIITAFHLLKSQLAWNGQYRLICEKMEKVLAEKSGSNADLNFVLMSILRSLGVQSCPVVMSRRSAGVMPIHFPTLQQLNTFIVAVYNPQTEKYVYVDSSMLLPAINVLPDELTVEKARLLTERLPEEKRWVNLSRLTNNRLAVNIVARIDSTTLSGHRSTAMTGKYAVAYQERQHASSANVERQTRNGTENHIEVRQKENDFTALQEETDFTLPLRENGDRLYVTPMVFPQLETNPFVQSKRFLPIEFDYPYQVIHTCKLQLPAGYEVEEMPQSQRVKTEDGTLEYSYWISREGNAIHLRYTFEVQTHTFPATFYKQIQQIWNRAVEQNKALIVLKRTHTKQAS